MKNIYTLLFYISLVFFSSFSLQAQEEKTEGIDTIQKISPYGLRLGIDLSKPVRSLFNEDYSGFEIQADFRITKRFYIAAEFGRDKEEQNESNLVSATNGSYLKIGADFNAYQNWLGMNNAIFTGLRYGVSAFSQDLYSYSIYTGNTTYPGTTIEEHIEYKDLTAHWVEFMFGVKAEVLKNLYLSINLQLKYKITEEKPDNFDNLFIPGFNKTNDYSEFGVGFGYSISYLIPIFKR